MLGRAPEKGTEVLPPVLWILVFLVFLGPLPASCLWAFVTAFVLLCYFWSKSSMTASSAREWRGFHHAKSTLWL